MTDILKDEKIIFHHIGKTAGTSFIKILDNYINFDDVLDIYPVAYTHYGESLKMNKQSFVRGHFKYSYLNQYLSVDINEYNLITFLRDPIDRIISLYQFSKDNADKFEDYDINTYNLMQVYKQSSSIDEFIDMLFNDNANPYFISQYINPYTRIFGSINMPTKNITENEFNNALNNISNYKFVGISELMEESLLIFAKTFNKIPEHEVRVNQNNNSRKLKDSISKETINKIKELNTLDLILYNKFKNILINEVTILSHTKKSNTDIYDAIFNANITKNTYIAKEFINLNIRNCKKLSGFSLPLKLDKYNNEMKSSYMFEDGKVIGDYSLTSSMNIVFDKHSNYQILIKVNKNHMKSYLDNVEFYLDEININPCFALVSNICYLLNFKVLQESSFNTITFKLKEKAIINILNIKIIKI